MRRLPRRLARVLKVEGYETERLANLTYHANERGFSYALLAITLPVLIGFVALVVDIGIVYEVRRQLQTAVDAAALAGAQELPISPGQAQAVALDYIAGNFQQPLASVNVTLSTTYYSNDTITADAVRTHPLLLLPVLGLVTSDIANTATISATATAIVGAMAVGKCVLPLGVVDGNGPGAGGSLIGNGFGYVFGDVARMEVGAQDGSRGNFQTLTVYESGGSSYQEGLAGICDPPLKVHINDWTETKTGDLADTTLSALETRIGSDDHRYTEVVVMQANGVAQILDHACPRLSLVPIIDSFAEGGSASVQVLGFALFFIESATLERDIGQTDGDQAVIYGRFLDALVAGEFSAYNPTGTRVVRLIR